MQSRQIPKTEQASAVRDLYRGAEDSWFFAGELQAEVFDHGRNALAFLRAWAERADADPSRIRESFARVELIHRQLGGLIDQQRRALEALPARLVTAAGAEPEREERARADVIAQLEREGALGGHRSGAGSRLRPRRSGELGQDAGVEE